MQNRIVAILGLACTMVLGSTTHAADFGKTLTGTVVFPAGKAIPPAKVIPNGACPVPKDKQPLTSQELVVNNANRGVKFTIVFLAKLDARGRPDAEAAIPVHPALKNPKAKQVIVDQPTCMFEPHMVAMRTGQTLVAKNSATVAHNVNIQGNDTDAPAINPLIPPGAQKEVKGPWKQSYRPVPVGCTIHTWMQGWIWVFDHASFAVTDANGKFTIDLPPAGKYNLIMWHETIGWVGGRAGKEVEIKKDGTLDVGKIALQ